MDKISSDGRVEVMCSTVSVFIMAFVLFYMFYSNNFFMKRRMKELGIYALLGYTKGTMIFLLTIENTIILSGGLVIGILSGSVLHKGLTFLIVHLLHLDIDLNEISFINVDAITFSLLFIMVVLITLTLSNIRLLGKSTLLDLVRLEKKREKPIKINKISAISGILLLIAGYISALNIVNGNSSLWGSIGFSPMALFTLLLVVFGTILFIYAFLPFCCNIIKGKKELLYSETAIIITPKFMQRIRSNAKSIILLILLTAGTLAVLGATILSTWYPVAALERIIPSAMEFRVSGTDKEMSVIHELDHALGQDSFRTYETKIFRMTAQSDHLPVEYNISESKGRKPGFECISLSDFNSLLKLQGKKAENLSLSDSECILVKYHPDPQASDIGSTYTLSLNEARTADVTVQDTTLLNPIGFGNSVGTLIVSDNLYDSISEQNIPAATVVSVNGSGLRFNKQAYQAVAPLLHDNPYFVSAYERRDELIHENSSTLLLISFASIIFLIATGSILYFQNISSVTYDKDDYSILRKMGYNKKMIQKIVRRQTKIYFLIPYVLGLLHSIFALICYKSALMDDILGQSSTVIAPIALSTCIFSLIYVIYYFITRQSCYKIALKPI